MSPVKHGPKGMRATLATNDRTHKTEAIVRVIVEGEDLDKANELLERALENLDLVNEKLDRVIALEEQILGLRRPPGVPTGRQGGPGAS